MPVIEQITLTNDELVDISCKMDDLDHHKIGQGYLEFLLFRAISDVKGVDMFALRPDECSCGDKKAPEAMMCDGCNKYNGASAIDDW